MRRERVAAVVLRQLYLMRGSAARVTPLFAWVAVDIVLWGFLSRYLGEVAGSGHLFVPTLLGAVLFWDFFTRVMHGVTMAFFEDVWARNFLNLFSTPLTVSEYLAGLVLCSMATSAVGLGAMLAVSTAVFGLSFAPYGAAAVPFLLVLLLFGVALGVTGAALVLRLGPAAEWFIWPVPALVAPFAGVFYPLSVLPGWMRAVGRCLPPSYVFEALRALVAGGRVSWMGLAGSAALAGVYVAAACGVFSRTWRYGIRTGLIARYSAESVG
ncbi:MAG: ABC transporter permease [Elusimicrobia bacterium]|nr:ABC transporter permease [Elusimicrobiota bacterium]